MPSGENAECVTSVMMSQWSKYSGYPKKEHDGGDDGSRPEPTPLNSKLWSFCFHQ